MRYTFLVVRVKKKLSKSVHIYKSYRELKQKYHFLYAEQRHPTPTQVPSAGV